ncbi:MAG: hypothetical protein Q8L07_03170 [Sediminibacterium sp.]|nr:hypothetical protein [Sediminibacterium sp.]
MKIDFNDLIQNKFQGKPSFTKEELVGTLSGFFDNQQTIAWRIHDLKTRGIINHLQRGLYALGGKKQYAPEIAARSKNIYNSIHQQLPYTNCCITETRWFNEFMRHQVFKTYLVVEVEKEATTVVFNSLLKAGEKAFLNPEAQVFENYISTSENAIIIKSLISESPIEQMEDINIPTLEKMLVDMICDTEIYSAQEAEAENIFKGAIEKYNVNLKKLMRYARRRNKANEINHYYPSAI